MPCKYMHIFNSNDLDLYLAALLICSLKTVISSRLPEELRKSCLSGRANTTLHLDQGSATFCFCFSFAKSQIVNILGSARHTASVTATHL